MRRLEEDVCNKCAVAPTADTTRKSVEPQTTSTLNMLLESAKDSGNQAAASFREAQTGVSAAREHVLGPRHAKQVGQIIGMAQVSAATSLGEIENGSTFAHALLQVSGLART